MKYYLDFDYNPFRNILRFFQKYYLIELLNNLYTAIYILNYLIK